MTMNKEGVKYDENKVRLDLTPTEAIWALGEVLTYGAKKYGEYNYLKGMAWHRLFGAALRHLWAWWGREDNDPESKLPHLYHALACIAILITYEKTKKGTDDRPEK